MKLRLLLLLGVFAAASAHAEIYKSVDANGRVTYSNIPSKGAVKLNLEPPASSARQKAASKAANFPKIDSETQKKRDDIRLNILEEELAAERKLLNESRRALAESETAPAAERGNQNFLERLQKLKEEVALHEKNIEALQKELGGRK